MSLPHPVKRDPQSTHGSLIERVFAADAALDADAFVKLLSDDVRLRIGSQPALQGKAAVRQAIGGVFGMMRAGLEHKLHERWESAETIVYEAEVTYHLKDGRDVDLPYTNVLRLTGNGLVQDYSIYIDLAPLSARS